MLTAKLTLLAAVAGVLFASPALAGPFVATRYTEPARLKNPKITQPQCVERAEAVLKSLDMTNIEGTQQSRYGTLREYTAGIRCIIDKQIIIFVASGPDRETTDRATAAMFERFEAAH